MVLTVSFVISPVTGLFCHRHRRLPANLTPASGRQDHTTSPSASSALVRSTVNVHRIPPHVRDDRETPLMRSGTAGVLDLIWVKPERKSFFRQDWTGEIRLMLQENFSLS
jgi:hypothetical protein